MASRVQHRDTTPLRAIFDAFRTAATEYRNQGMSQSLKVISWNVNGLRARAEHVERLLPNPAA